MVDEQPNQQPNKLLDDKVAAMASLSKRAFDLLVVGGGSGGVRAARIAASYGAKVGLCELQPQHGPPYYAALGGTCVNVGCVPKKLMMYGSQFQTAFDLSRSYGWNLPIPHDSHGHGRPDVDWSRLTSRMGSELTRLNEVYANMLTNAGVELLFGHASLADPNTVEISSDVGGGGAATETVTAEKILICVGGWPKKPDVPGMEEHAITSNEMFYLPEIPRRLCVVGGGYIAVEFASIMRGFGSEVTLLHRGDELLRGFDMDVRRRVQESQRAQLNSWPTAVTKASSGSGALTVSVENAGGEQWSFDTDVVLCATGRVPRTAGIGLENAGVQTDENGAIIVDETSCTTAPNRSVFAVGDVTDRMNLTPVALLEGAMPGAGWV